MPQSRPRRSGVIDGGELRFHANADHRFRSHNEIFTVQITDGNVDEATLTLRIDDALIPLLERFEFGEIHPFGLTADEVKMHGITTWSARHQFGWRPGGVNSG